MTEQTTPATPLPKCSPDHHCSVDGTTCVCGSVSVTVTDSVKDIMDRNIHEIADETAKQLAAEEMKTAALVEALEAVWAGEGVDFGSLPEDLAKQVYAALKKARGED